MSEVLTQTNLCSYCCFILQTITDFNKKEEYKELIENEFLKVNKYTNSPCLPIIEEAINIPMMDVPNIAKLIAEYGITTNYIRENNEQITHHYWGEIVRESATFKSQSIYDPTHTYVIKYKEWLKEVTENNEINLKLTQAYIANKNGFILNAKWNKQGESISTNYKFENLNFKRWKNMTIHVKISLNYFNINCKKLFFYFEDDKYIHDAEFDKNNKLVGITHIPNNINDPEYTIIDEYKSSNNNSLFNFTTGLKYCLIAASILTIGIKYYNKLKIGLKV